jgi:hypothetical protein
VNECLSLVSTTLAINPCHGFSVIAGVVDTSGKLATRPLTRVPMDAPFHEGFDDTIGGHIRPRRLEILMPSHDCVSSQFCRKKRDLYCHNSLWPVSLIPVRNNQKTLNLSPV